MSNWLWGLVFLVGLSSTAQAQQNSLITNCTVDSQESSELLNCDVRLLKPGKVKDVSLSVGDQVLSEPQYTSFKDLGKSAAWLFLIDRSNPKRARTVARKIALVKSIVEKSRDNQHFGIATFANDLRVIVSLGDENADLDRRLSDVKADGAATEFFATAIQGIKLLEQFDADRRALVIMSDGKAEDKAYKHEDVVNAARQAGVVIYGMGFAERASETPDLQVLQRLAEDTGGPMMRVAGDEDIPIEFIEDFKDYLQNGGSVTADVSSIDGQNNVKLKIDLKNGASFEHTQSLVFAGLQEEEEPPPPLSAIAKIYKTFEFMSPNASAWANSNPVPAMLLLLLFGLIALVAIVLGLRRRATGEEDEPVTESVEEEEAGTRAISSVSAGGDGPVLAWFEMLDDQSNRFEIRQSTINIGRHSDNDFRLNNDSVHRHHAHFHFSPDMKPTIADLDTVNGVVVNGKRVGKIELKSGDMIELGEVRFRFVDDG